MKNYVYIKYLMNKLEQVIMKEYTLLVNKIVINISKLIDI